ncbi:GNAT family N-acetyltransferase [Parafrankia sp. EUN1f]|uniref:GNAT family N-acetyltransferase n=1 Tax=Parafrankia sp. EUN1f TaxID=102897 RepID=UPI0001C45101|nr:GNAT family N-acetyltransferase [Parafrankia sp. EUN1f]EFC85189.1 conserved hypothetical protein [Parafrankia sp. EUN1f]
MDVTVVDNAPASRFEARTETGEVAGFATYTRTKSAVTFVHTVVDPAFKGTGVGSTLAAAALDAVRAEGLAVVPRCPFIRAFIDRHPEYADLVQS